MSHSGGPDGPYRNGPGIGGPGSPRRAGGRSSPGRSGGRWRRIEKNIPARPPSGSCRDMREKADLPLAQRRILLYNTFRTCRCDGIGRRSGLKIHRWRQRTGSSPVTGTTSSRTLQRSRRRFLFPSKRCPSRIVQSPFPVRTAGAEQRTLRRITEVVFHC